MPNFFDKKEEVISLELTQYGKYLLSIGKLQPVYYAFYDDDVLYDTKFTGYIEEQSESQSRILEDTPTMKAQYARHGIETQVHQAIDLIRSGSIGQDQPEGFVQQNTTRMYFPGSPMGTSEYGSSYAPAWDVRMLESTIEDTSEWFTGSFENIRIPRIDLKASQYTSKVIQGTVPDLEEEACDPMVPGDIPAQTGPDLNILNDVNITSQRFPDGTYMTIKQENVILQVDEINSMFTNDNFDIEVFLVEEDDDEKEFLVPLYFIKPPDKIVDGILIDLPDEEEPEITKENVEYYLDILVDKEVPDQHWVDKGASHRKSDMFYNEEELDSCSPQQPDIAIQGLYASNNVGPFGEEC